MEPSTIARELWTPLHSESCNDCVTKTCKTFDKCSARFWMFWFGNKISGEKGKNDYPANFLKRFRVNGGTARISGTGQITAIVSNHSCPSISAGGWPGIQFSSILESPLWSRMATLFTRWPTFSPSSCPVWRARALPSLLNCSRATLSQSPKMEQNISSCVAWFNIYLWILKV